MVRKTICVICLLSLLLILMMPAGCENSTEPADDVSGSFTPLNAIDKANDVSDQANEKQRSIQDQLDKVEQGY